MLTRTVLCHVYCATVCIRLNISIDFGLSRCIKGCKSCKGVKMAQNKELLSRFSLGLEPLVAPLICEKSLETRAWLVGRSVGGIPGDLRECTRCISTTLVNTQGGDGNPFLRQRLPHTVIIHSLPGSLRTPVKSFRSLPHACLHILAVLDAVHERSARVHVCRQSYVCFHNSLWAPNAP